MLRHLGLSIQAIEVKTEGTICLIQGQVQESVGGEMEGAKPIPQRCIGYRR